MLVSSVCETTFTNLRNEWNTRCSKFNASTTHSNQDDQIEIREEAKKNKKYFNLIATSVEENLYILVFIQFAQNLYYFFIQLSFKGNALIIVLMQFLLKKIRIIFVII